jgi:hypothetical protein
MANLAWKWNPERQLATAYYRPLKKILTPNQIVMNSVKPSYRRIDTSDKTVIDVRRSNLQARPKKGRPKGSKNKTKKSLPAQLHGVKFDPMQYAIDSGRRVTLPNGVVING